MQEIIKQIDELTEANRVYRREMNEKLCEIRNKLGKMKVGSGNDWDLAASICQLRQETLLNVFGSSDPVFIFLNYKPDEAKQSLDEYFGTHKETEEEIIKPGDRVDFVYSDNKAFIDYIFVGENIDSYIGIAENATAVTFFNRSMWDMVKREG